MDFLDLEPGFAILFLICEHPLLDRGTGSVREGVNSLHSLCGGVLWICNWSRVDNTPVV